MADKKQILTIPSWNADETFTVDGIELQQIAELAMKFEPLVNLWKNILTREIQSEKIKVIYKNSDDTPLTEEDLALINK